MGACLLPASCCLHLKSSKGCSAPCEGVTKGGMHAGATTTRFLESLPFQPKAIEVLQPGMNTTIQARASATPVRCYHPCTAEVSRDRLH